MVNDTPKVLPIAAFIRKSDGDFTMRVRWVMGKEGDRLPRHDDRFLVQAQLTASGTEVLPEQVVRPRVFAMVDPPREEAELDPLSGARWMIAKEPSGPVVAECPANGELPSDQGFGVYHLLCEVHESRAEWRSAVRLIPACREARLRVARSDGGGVDQALIDGEAERLARHIARVLVRGHHRPDFLPRLLNRAVKELPRLFDPSRGPYPTRSETSWSDPLSLLIPPTPESSKGKTAELPLPSFLEYAALVLEVFAEKQLRQDLDKLIDNPARLRGHLRIRALLGGNLLDFWCSPDQSVPAGSCAEPARAKAYPASELIGLGVSVGSFSPAQLQAWIDAGESVRVNVAHDPPSRRPASTKLSPGPNGEAGDLFLAGSHSEEPLAPGDYIISGVTPRTLPGLQKTLATGSSFPPLEPAIGSCRVNFDLIQVNAGSKPDPDSPIPFTRQVGFGTGDGRVEIHIDLIPDTENKHVAGFNVYGIWETPETSQLFQNPTQQIVLPLPELSKWLITRRYSYERDLKRGFPGLETLIPTSPSALPLPDDQLDPRLLTIVDPPWQPLIERPKSIIDEEEGDELPTGIRPMVTVFTHDLRVGMESGLTGGGVRKFVGWDLDARIKTEWSPEKTRNGQAADTHPQGYRFWVTCIDNLDQESAPVPVQTHDAEAGEEENYVFRPKRRTALPPPPNQKIEKITLEADDRRFRLKITWETPFLNQVGQFNPTDTLFEQTVPRRADRRELEGHLILFRRRLRHDEDAEEVSAADTLDQNLLATLPFGLPQWLSVRRRLEKDGWEVLASWASIDGATFSDDTWFIQRDFTHTDRAYEYRAALGLSLKSSSPWRPYWMSPVIAGLDGAGRTLRLVDEGGNPQPISMTEVPTSTAVAETSIVAVSNPAEPRGPSPLPAPQFLPAAPVLPPPEKSRDLILLRLLSLPFEGDTPTEWRRTGVFLTYGQAASLDAALERAVERAPSPIPLDDERLDFARQILANELKPEPTHSLRADEAPPYRRHTTLGFRGLVRVNPNYDPTDLQPNESPAVAWVIYHTRAEVEQAAARAFATFKGRATRVELDVASAVYQVEAPGDALEDPGFAAIRESGRPVLARLDERGLQGDFLFGDLLSIEVSEAPSILVRIGSFAGDATEFPTLVELSLFLAKPLIEESIKDDRAPATLHQYLPVGGGPQDFHCWWIATRSEKGIETGPGRRRPLTFLGERTVEPSPPKLLRIDPPQADEQYVLDPVQFGEWVPSRLATLAQADRAPRLVVTWVSTDPDPKINLLLERDEQIVPTRNHIVALNERTPWAAIVAISSANESLPLNKLDVDALRWTWLKGKFVLIDGTTADTQKVHVGPGRTPDLPARTGLRDLEVPVESRQELTIANTATLILDGGDLDGISLFNASEMTIYLGNAAVTTSNGRPLEAGATVPATNRPGEEVYGIVAAGTATLHLIRIAIEARPAFIDYFQHREADRSLVMDANYRYSYSASTYLVIDAPEGTPPEWRRLASPSTAFTDYFRPETARIRVEALGKTTTPSDELGPRVTFQFEAPQDVMNLISAEESWRYRVTVRRRRDFSIQKPGVPQDPGYEDVGQPVSVWPGQTVAISDIDIERSAIDAPLDVEYEIIALQYRDEGQGGSREERLVRSQSGSDGSSSPHHELQTIDPAAEDHEQSLTLKYRLR